MPRRVQSAREEREFEAYVKALLLNSENDDKVLDALAELDVPSPYRVRVKVVYAETSPKAVIDHLAKGRKLKRLTDRSASYIYEARIGDTDESQVRVPFFIADFKREHLGNGLNAIVAVCKTYPWQALRRFLNREYPDIVPILLSQSELIRGARLLKQETGHDVHVTAFSAKETLQGITGKRRKSVREWTDEELDKALLNIQDRHQLLTSLDVDFFPRMGSHSHIRPKASCKIRKDGEIEVSGSFSLAFHTVAAQVARVGEHKLKFFSGRGLREAHYDPKPLAINFPRPVFDEVATVRNLVHVLSKYPRSMHAVAHGNPYAQVRLTDLFDGSSFDVWAIPPQRIALVPGLKASEAAVERLVHYIFDTFREGQIATYDDEGRTLEDASQ
ncbi:MAG: hypothetical protein AABO41_20075 [Acidobacteriota bacterium]